MGTACQRSYHFDRPYKIIIAGIANIKTKNVIRMIPPLVIPKYDGMKGPGHMIGLSITEIGIDWVPFL